MNTIETIYLFFTGVFLGVMTTAIVYEASVFTAMVLLKFL